MSDVDRRSGLVIAGVQHACKILIFLCLLPAMAVYLHVKPQMRVDGDFVSVRSIDGGASGSYDGLYCRLANLDSSSSVVTTHVYRPWLDTIPKGADVIEASRAIPSMVSRRSIMMHQNEKTDRPYLRDGPSEEIMCAYTGSPANDQLMAESDPISNNHCVHQVSVIRKWSTTSPSSSSSSSSRSKNQFWKELTMDIPTTSLIVALNVGLAAIYWNYRISPDQVAKFYPSMVQAPHEIWRSFSGATAHFEIWHLGLNMMSLLALGRELEGRKLYPPIPFFFYNISLIPIITAIWLLLQWLADRYRGASAAGNTMTTPHRPTVGYSGVLFAWMVVASLEQRQTCPVMFLPSLCFSTYQWHGLKWSLAPVVQLGVLQVLLPRVSFAGHLAGILAGFALHWGLLPIGLVQPILLIPALYLLYLGSIRRILPLTRSQISKSLAALGGIFSKTTTTTTDSSFQRSLSWMLAMHILVWIGSIGLFGAMSSFTISMAIATLWFWSFVGSHDHEEASSSSSNVPPSTSVTVGRGYILTGVLVIINDAMALGLWHALFIDSTPHAILVMARIMTLLLAIFLAQLRVRSLTGDGGGGGGILEATLGWTTIQPMHALSQQFPWSSKLALSTGNPSNSDIEADDARNSSTEHSRTGFMGGGQRLGGSAGRRQQGQEEGTRRELSRLLN